jgi:hypothetical protein
MCADKKKTTGHEPMEVLGQVIIKPYATGSKSERNAVFIQSSAGTYLLRRQGGNPFHDDSLEKLEGKQVKVKGLLDRNLFLAKEIEELD